MVLLVTVENLFRRQKASDFGNQLTAVIYMLAGVNANKQTQGVH